MMLYDVCAVWLYVHTAHTTYNMLLYVLYVLYVVYGHTASL